MKLQAVLSTGTLPSPIAMTPPPTTPPAEKKEGIIPETVVQTVEPTPNQSENESIEETPTTCSREEQETSSNDTPCLPPEKIEIVDTPQPSPRVTGRTRAPKPGRPGNIVNYRMAEEMRDDVMDQIQSYIATQLMVQSSDRDSTKMLRGHRSDVFHFFL
ncbi:hypothetical protein AC249_AIPGENE10652 [Exaiptasia diaphana]|nr:hypothetical protein AC249_AIPGENE10652 [Exaiptasia diaphana]